MFMGGKLATMLWEDGIQIVSGGDESNFTGDPVIADSHAGSGSSVPGGPGVRSTAPRQPAGDSKAAGASKRRKGQPDKNEELRANAALVVGQMKASADLDLGNMRAEASADRARELETLTDDVERLQGKLDNTSSADNKKMYAKLLKRAQRMKKRFEEEEEKEEAAAAES